MTDWIPSQVGLRDHPKTRRLARMLDAEPPHVIGYLPVSYTHLRAHETVLDLVCRLLLEKKNTYP